MRHFPDSIATSYIKRSRGVPHRFPLLWAAVKRGVDAAVAEEGESSSSGRILNHTAFHLRTGDVVERDRRSVAELLAGSDWDG